MVKGFGKDYEDGKIHYKGEYLNGKRHGKGKLYRRLNTDMEFTGEFFEGKIWKGYGKKYHWQNNNLEYKGEFANGIKDGKGKEYDINGNLIYEGE